MSVESFTPTALQFTHGAAHKVKSLVDEEGNDRLKLRVFVTGGGCSGFQYGFTSMKKWPMTTPSLSAKV
jgi:Uncharacterized conserved protein